MNSGLPVGSSRSRAGRIRYTGQLQEGVPFQFVDEILEKDAADTCSGISPGMGVRWETVLELLQKGTSCHRDGLQLPSIKSKMGIKTL